MVRARHMTRSVPTRDLTSRAYECHCGRGKRREGARQRAFVWTIPADGIILRGTAAKLVASWKDIGSPPYLWPRYGGRLGTAECRFGEGATRLQQHNASLRLILQKEHTSSYAQRRLMSTAVGRARGDIITAHAIGDWRAPPGAAGQSFAGCMPCRYSGLRSETSAEVKEEVIAAMRTAFSKAKAANAGEDKYWNYTPKHLAVLTKLPVDLTDEEEVMQLEVAGSDASESEYEGADLTPVQRVPMPPLTKHKVPSPDWLWWASVRRGPHTRRQYADTWCMPSGEDVPPGETLPPSAILKTVCRKVILRPQRAAEHDAVLSLQECTRCFSSGPVLPLPERPAHLLFPRAPSI